MRCAEKVQAAYELGRAEAVAAARTAVQEWIWDEEWSPEPLWAALDAIAGGTT